MLDDGPQLTFDSFEVLKITGTISHKPGDHGSTGHVRVLLQAIENLSTFACFEISWLAASFTGDSHGQSKEARCGAQEGLETREGKRQACTQKGGKGGSADKGKIQGSASG
jgi:hypothetical protein